VLTVPQASIKRYEVNISKAIELKEGMKALDLGCGVGGPMRTIAAASGAHVTGITINEYQVKRATEHNVAAGLATRCTVVQGNFLALPFAPATFDGAYCIEAACHAPKLVELYAQVFKALKPGAKFASYEWLKTPIYDANNPAHVRVVDGVAEGNALPDVRDLADVLAAAKAVGFTVVNCTDAALGAEIPWHAAMKSARMFSYITHYTTALLELIGWAPAGTAAVHKMLINAALDLEESGRLGVFTVRLLSHECQPVPHPASRSPCTCASSRSLCRRRDGGTGVTHTVEHLLLFYGVSIRSAPSAL